MTCGGAQVIPRRGSANRGGLPIAAAGSCTVTAMEVIDGPALPAEESWPTPVCVLLKPAAADLLAEAARRVGASAPVAEWMRDQPPRRPLAQVEDGRISLVAFAVDDLGVATPVHMHVGNRGLLVLCPDAAAVVINRAVEAVEGSPEDALLVVLLALALMSQEAMQRLSDNALALDATTIGVTSGARRRAIAQARTRLFWLQQLAAAHQQTLSRDDLLFEAMPATTQPALRRAAAIFAASGTTAGQLYALLGDTLSRQATIISERLTLVAVIFFPLTVSTGFFGMNFNWLTGQIGSAAAFGLLGIVLPCVLVAATLLGARWLTRD